MSATGATGATSTITTGMSEDIEVEFVPTEWRYYYDTIKIHCAGEDNLLIPIHAYPVMNDISFPTKIDLGACPLGECVKRTVKLDCQVPIEFEYELTPLTPLAEFRVTPLRGRVPAHKPVFVEIEYRPLRRLTSTLQLQIHISQFGFKPFICTITGSSNDGSSLSTYSSKSRTSASITAKTSQLSQTIALENTLPPIQSPQVPAPPKRARSEEKHGRPACRPEAKAAADYIELNNIRIPLHLDSHSSANFVLTQQPGKLMPADLRKAIMVHKMEAEEDAKELVETKVSSHDHDHEFDYSDIADVDIAFQGTTGQMKEMIFLKANTDYIQHEKMLDSNPTKGRTGMVVMTSDTLSAIEATTYAARTAFGQQTRDVDRRRDHPEGTKERVKYVWGDEIDVHATFNPTLNDDWSKRKRVLDSFIISVSKMVVRNRFDTRLRDALKALIGGSDAKPPEAPAEFVFSVEQVSPQSWLPELARGSMMGERKAWAIDEDMPDFVSTPISTNFVPFEYMVLGYKRAEIPVVPLYNNLHLALARAGALEEQSARGPEGEVGDILGKKVPELELLAAMTTDLAGDGDETLGAHKKLLSAVLPDRVSIPACCLRTPSYRDPLDAVRTNPALTVYTRLLPCETDAGWHLRAEPIESTLVHPSHVFNKWGLDSVRPARSETTVSNVWRPSLDPLDAPDWEELDLNPDDLGLLRALSPDDIRNMRDEDKDEYKDDGLGFKAPTPSFELAINLFSSDMAAGVSLGTSKKEAAPVVDKKGKDKGSPSKDTITVVASGECARIPLDHTTRAEAESRVDRLNGEQRMAATYHLSNAISSWNRLIVSSSSSDNVLMPAMLYPPVP